MVDIKSIIEDLGNESFEKRINLAGVAVLNDIGNLIFQTKNWDISKNTRDTLDIFNGANVLVINNMKFFVTESKSEVIVAASEIGMGFMLFIRCNGGFLISYAIPGVDTSKALNILNKYKEKIKNNL